MGNSLEERMYMNIQYDSYYIKLGTHIELFCLIECQFPKHQWWCPRIYSGFEENTLFSFEGVSPKL